MSHDYIIGRLVDERMADLRHEADQDRLARLARSGQPHRRRWWERLMLFRTGPAAGTAAHQPAAHQPAAHQPAAHQPAAAVTAGNSPC